MLFTNIYYEAIKMTILSRNLKRLREENGYTKEYISNMCDTSASAVAQWEYEVDAYIPTLDKLFILASLYKTTVDELYRNVKVKSGELITAAIEEKVLNKVFRTLDKSETLSYALAQATVKRRAHLFILLYSICEGISSNYLDETEVIAFMDSPNVTKKRKTAKGVRSRRTAGTRKKVTKKH